MRTQDTITAIEVLLGELKTSLATEQKAGKAQSAIEPGIPPDFLDHDPFDEPRYRICIKDAGPELHAPCAICERAMSLTGPAYFLDGTQRAVCEPCADIYASELVEVFKETAFAARVRELAARDTLPNFDEWFERQPGEANDLPF